MSPASTDDAPPPEARLAPGRVALSPAGSAQTDDGLLGRWRVLQILDADGDVASEDRFILSFRSDGCRLARSGDPDAEEDLQKLSYRVEADEIVALTERGREQRMRYRFEDGALLLVNEDVDETATLERVPDRQ